MRLVLIAALSLCAHTGYADDLTAEGGDLTTQTLDNSSLPETKYVLAPTDTPKTLSLETCIEQATTKHARVALSEEDLIAADAAAKQAMANLFPKLSTVLKSTHTQGALPSEISPPGIGSDIGLILNIPVFHGTELFSTRALRSAAHAKMQLHEHLKHSVELRTKELYHVALTAKRVVGLRARQVERANTLLESSKRRKKAGLHTSLDLKRAEYTLLKAKESEDDAQSALRAALGNLGLFIGEDVHFELLPVTLPKPADVANELAQTHEDLFVVALGHRLDLKAQTQWLEAARIELTGAWLSFAPSIDLDGEAHYAISGVGPDRPHLLTELNLTISLPLFEAGSRLESVRQAKAKWRREKLRLDYMKREVQLALRGTMDRLRGKQIDLAVKKEARELAQAVYQSTQNLFNEGLATAFEIQESTNTLTTAETEEEQEWLEYALLKAQLDYTIGVRSIVAAPELL